MDKKYFNVKYKEYLIVAVVSLVAYGNSLKSEFLHDDIKAIIKNKDVLSPIGSSNLWKNDFWGVNLSSSLSHKSYRPITILSFRLSYFLWSEWSAAFRAENILLHCSCSLLFVKFCKKLIFTTSSTRLDAPLISGVLFALHPVHTEAVNAVVGRADLLSSLFFFLALLLYNDKKDLFGSQVSFIKDSNILDASISTTGYQQLRHRKVLIKSSKSNEQDIKAEELLDKKKAFKQKSHFHSYEVFRLFFVIILSLFSTLCKETGITVFPLLIAIKLMNTFEIICLNTKPNRSNFLSSIIHIFVLTIFCFLTIYFRLWIMNFELPNFHEMDNPAAKTRQLSTRIMTYAALPWINMCLLFFPYFLCYDWSYGTVPLISRVTDFRNIISIFFYIFLVAFLYIQACLLYEKSPELKPLFLGTLLLVITFIPSSNLFFPVGFVVAERNLYLPSSGFAVLLVFIYFKLKQHYPRNKFCFQIAFLVYLTFYLLRTVCRNDDWTSKYKFHRSCVIWNPENAKCQYNFANTLFARKQYQNAKKHYEKTLELYPKPDAMHNLAYLLEIIGGEKKKIEKLYKEAIKTSPYISQSYLSLTKFYINHEEYKQSELILLKSFKLTADLQIAEVLYLLNLLSNKEQLKQCQYCYKILLCRICNKNAFETVPDLSKCGEDAVNSLIGYYEILTKLNNIETAKEVDLVINQIGSNKSAEIMYKIAAKAVNDGNPRTAVTSVLKALLKHDLHENKVWQIASKLFHRRYFNESEQVFAALRKLSPKNVELLSQHAAALYEVGKTVQSEQMLEKGIEEDLDCNFLSLRKHLSVVYMKQSLFQKAEEVFKKCLKKFEDQLDNSRKVELTYYIIKIKIRYSAYLKLNGYYKLSETERTNGLKMLGKVLTSSKDIPKNVLELKQYFEAN